MKITLIAIGIIFILAIGYIIGGKYDYEKIESLLTKKEIVTSYDTTFVFKTDSLNITKRDVKTIYTHSIDTIFIDKAFIKQIDTTIDQSRLQVSYYFPQDTFKVKLHAAIKEILRTDTIKTFVTIPQYKTDYMTPVLSGIAGIGAGVLIGVLIK